MSIMAMEARSNAIILEIAIIPPLPKMDRIFDEALNESHTIKRFAINEIMVGTMP